MSKNRVIVYMTNEHPFYMSMALNSMRMLREHNKAEKVVVFLVEDQAKETVQRPNMLHSNVTKDMFINGCLSQNIFVIKKPPLNLPGEEGYFYVHRHYLREVQEPTIFYIDVDTFIFGDVSPLIDRYSDVSFAGSENTWVWSKGFTTDMLPVRPYNSGVMVWNNGWCQKWAAELPNLSKEIRTTESPLSTWMSTTTPPYLGREEFSVTLFIVRNGLTHKAISDDDCWLIKNHEDLNRIGKSTIFHSYTNHWREAFGRINEMNKQRRPLKYVTKKVML